MTDGAPSRRRARPSRGSARRSRPQARVRPRPRRSGRERGLAEDVPRDRDRLDPLAPVLLGREVVEYQRRVRPRVRRADADRPPRIGVHRPDVHLVAVAARGCGPVVADRERQEVEHQVRIGDVLVAADEAAGLEVVRRARARCGRTATGTRSTAGATSGSRGAAWTRARCSRAGRTPRGGPGGCGRRPAGAGPARCPGRAGASRFADPGELEQLRRVDRPACEDHLARAHAVVPAPGPVLDAGRAPPVERDRGDERGGADLEIRAAHRGREVRASQPTGGGRGGCSDRTPRSPPGESR